MTAIREIKWFASYTVHQDRSITVFFKSGDREFGGLSSVRAIGSDYFDRLYACCENHAEMHGGRLESLCVDMD